MSSATTQRPFKNGQAMGPGLPNLQYPNSFVPHAQPARPSSRSSKNEHIDDGSTIVIYDQGNQYMPTSNSASQPDIATSDAQIQSPHFSFDDFLTPEYSSENPISEHSAHATPYTDDRLWEHNKTDERLHQALSNAGPEAQTRPLFYSHEAHDLQGLTSTPATYYPRLVSGSQLLSPQLTTTPSPPEPVNLNLHVSSGRPGNNLVTPPATSMNKRKLNADSLHLQTSSDFHHSGRSNHASLESSPTEPIARAISPIVMVSSYTRGDSPARPRVPLSRNASKRSQGSRSSDLLAPRVSNGLEEDLSPSSGPNSSNLVISARALHDSDENPGFDRTGLHPGQRGAETVPSLSDNDESRKLHEKNADVENWLATSEAGSQVDAKEARKGSGRQKSHLRSRSTGAPVDALGIQTFNDAHIPGPGVLIAQESDIEESDDEHSRSDMTGSESRSFSPPAEVDTHAHLANKDTFPSIDEIAPDEQEPLPRQFIRSTPWQDPVRGTDLSNTHHQPGSSNAAIFRFGQAAANFETASRAATWGTRRRLSETEVSSIVEGSKIRHLSLSKKGRERGASIFGKFIRRTPSNSKRKAAETAGGDTPPEAGTKQQKEAISAGAPLQHTTSAGTSASLVPTTGSTLGAKIGHLTAVGRSTSATPETTTSTNPFNLLKRNRSKSELPKGAGLGKSTGGLAELLTQHGGPPMPTLASPMQERRTSNPQRAPRVSDDDDDDDDDDEDELMSDRGTRMDFTIRADNIIPTLEGFKTHARQLNPRLEPFLIERIGQEQLRRYKKLVDSKIKHTQAVEVHRKCPSGTHCFGLNGEATILPPRTNAKDPELTYAQFQITGHGDTDEDEAEFPEGVVTPALFPPGIPLPPVKRLPAEFECSLCFKVKKFQKPSDWTKHVHEDVQPFSCTFPNCTDPKSFKRKADWVRHENERHRHLEWWQCNIRECNHICYRKDNFVQHLVREHKLPEPKVKRGGSGSSKARPADNGSWKGQESDEVWRLLDICHHETPSRPRDEICKFCGNMCSTWKKVSSHLGKHMEQIALPVLELVRQREVSPDTIISPIEQNYPPQLPMISGNTGMVYRGGDNQGMSPYPMSTSSLYQGSSGGHSPVAMHSYNQGVQMQYVTGYQSTVVPQAHMQAHTPDMADFATIPGSPSNMAYGQYANAPTSHSLVPINCSPYPPPYPTVRRSPLPAQPPPQIPRSLPPQHDMQSMQFNQALGQMYHPQQQHQAIYSSPVDAQRYATHYGQPSAQPHNITQVKSHIDFEPIEAIAPHLVPDEQGYDPQHFADYPMPVPGQQHAEHSFPY